MINMDIQPKCKVYVCVTVTLGVVYPSVLGLYVECEGCGSLSVQNCVLFLVCQSVPVQMCVIYFAQ